MELERLKAASNDRQPSLLARQLTKLPSIPQERSKEQDEEVMKEKPAQLAHTPVGSSVSHAQPKPDSTHITAASIGPVASGPAGGAAVPLSSGPPTVLSSTLRPLQLDAEPFPTATQLESRRQRALSGQLRYNCFLSHKRSDSADLARSLKEKLLSDFDLSAFLDEDSQGDIGDALLEEVQNSYALVLLLTTNLFSSIWCAREVLTAVRWGVPVIMVQVANSGWNVDGQTYEFPPPKILQMWPQEVRPTLEGSKAVQHNRTYFKVFMETLAERIQKCTLKASGLKPTVAPVGGARGGRLVANGAPIQSQPVSPLVGSPSPAAEIPTGSTAVAQSSYGPTAGATVASSTAPSVGSRPSVAPSSNPAITPVRQNDANVSKSPTAAASTTVAGSPSPAAWIQPHDRDVLFDFLSSRESSLFTTNVKLSNRTLDQILAAGGSIAKVISICQTLIQQLKSFDSATGLIDAITAVAATGRTSTALAVSTAVVSLDSSVKAIPAFQPPAWVTQSHRDTLFAYLSSPECSLFSTDVKLNNLSLNRFLAAGGSMEKTLSLCRMLNGEQEQFVNADGLAEALARAVATGAVPPAGWITPKDRDALLAYLSLPSCSLFSVEMKLSNRSLNRLLTEGGSLAETVDGCKELVAEGSQFQTVTSVVDALRQIRGERAQRAKPPSMPSKEPETVVSVPIEIGKAYVYLRALSQLVEIENEFIIIDRNGDSQGELSVVIYPQGPNGEDLDYLSSPDELLGRDVTFVVRITEARDLPPSLDGSPFASVFVQFQFWNQPVQVTQTVDPKRAQWKFETRIQCHPVMPELLQYLREDSLICEVRGFC